MDIEQKVAHLYREYAAGHLNTVMNELPDNFCFEWPFEPATARYSGTCYSKVELGSKLADLIENFHFEEYAPIQIIAAGDSAAAQLKLVLTSRMTGRTFDARIAHFWRFENGVPVHLIEYMDTALMASESPARAQSVT